MKDSEFLERAMSHMGTPEKWCQRTLFKADITKMSNDRQRGGDYFLAEHPEYIASMCMEGALIVAERQYMNETKENCPQAQRVRVALRDAMIEQFPDIVHRYRCKIAQQNIPSWMDEDSGLALQAIATEVFNPQELTLPLFNDHPAMTYEGMRSVCEKTVAKLQEEGR